MRDSPDGSGAIVRRAKKGVKEIASLLYPLSKGHRRSEKVNAYKLAELSRSFELGFKPWDCKKYFVCF